MYFLKSFRCQYLIDRKYVWNVMYVKQYECIIIIYNTLYYLILDVYFKLTKLT